MILVPPYPSPAARIRTFVAYGNDTSHYSHIGSGIGVGASGRYGYKLHGPTTRTRGPQIAERPPIKGTLVRPLIRPHTPSESH